MTEAIYNASKGKEPAKEIAADPLMQNGAKLIPSVTRVFSKSRSLYVYLQAYEGATPAPAATGNQHRSHSDAADLVRQLLPGTDEGVGDTAAGGVAAAEYATADCAD